MGREGDMQITPVRTGSGAGDSRRWRAQLRCRGCLSEQFMAVPVAVVGDVTWRGPVFHCHTCDGRSAVVVGFMLDRRAGVLEPSE